MSISINDISIADYNSKNSPQASPLKFPLRRCPTPRLRPAAGRPYLFSKSTGSRSSVTRKTPPAADRLLLDNVTPDDLLNGIDAVGKNDRGIGNNQFSIASDPAWPSCQWMHGEHLRQ